MGVEWEQGEQFGRYTVGSRLGAGGMGVVYRVRDCRLQRWVALKVITADMAGTAEFRARFKREALLLAKVVHPNVLPLHDSGEHDGHLYLVTPLVDGGDLRGLLSRTARLTDDHVLRIADQIARALDATHAANIVHRDVKPANVLLDGPYGQENVYVADFGLARPTDASSALTRSGEGHGTFDYAAPEQFKGDQVGPAADVYALALVVHEMLFGHTPGLFHRDPLSLPDTGPWPGADRLEAVLGRALSREPADRHASAGALVADLRAAIGTGASSSSVSGGDWTPLSAPLVPSTVPPDVRAPGRGLRRVLLMLVVVVLLTAGASAMVGRRSRTDQTPPTPPATEAAPVVQAPRTTMPTTVPSTTRPTAVLSTTAPSAVAAPPAVRRAVPPPSLSATVQPAVVREVCKQSMTVRREPQPTTRTVVLATLRRGDTFQILDTPDGVWAYGVSSGSTRVRGWVLLEFFKC